MDKLKLNGLEYKQLVSLITDSGSASPDSEARSIEAAFRIPGFRGLRLDTRNWNQQASSFFAFRSARTPKNLLNHVQRIIHHIQQKNPEDVYGALLDLFIVLENHGPALRARMLEYARPLLQPAQYDSLHKLLDGNTPARESLPSAHRSMLSNGFSGTFRLVEKLNDGAESDRADSGATGDP